MNGKLVLLQPTIIGNKTITTLSIFRNQVPEYWLTAKELVEGIDFERISALSVIPRPRKKPC